MSRTIFRTVVGLGLALVVTASSLAAQEARPIKVLIDADPGVDDSMAILFALRSPRLEVVGITTVFGNTTLENGTANALTLVDLLGVDVPVARGAEAPLVKPRRDPPDFVHGKDGLGETGLQKVVGSPRELSAAHFIVDTVRRHPGEVVLLPVGPLTNIALALAIEPRLPELVKEVVLMGGAARVEGNVSPVAEANIFGDPHAADIVFRTDWPVTMVGLDVTTAVRMADDRLKRLAEADPDVGGFIYSISRFYKEFYESRGVTGGFYVHDPSAVAYVVDPTLFETRKGRVRVDTEGRGEGQTITTFDEPPDFWTDWHDAPWVTVCVGVDEGRLLDLYERTVGQASP